MSNPMVARLIVKDLQLNRWFMTGVVIAGLVGSGGGGLTALILASREGDLESAKLLLDKGANINQVTEYGWSPLLTATNNRHYKLGQFLIERGADINLAKQRNGPTGKVELVFLKQFTRFENLLREYHQ